MTASPNVPVRIAPGAEPADMTALRTLATGAATLLRAAFLDGMAGTATTVAVVATDGPAGRSGLTVSSLTSVSADGERPTLLVCVRADSPTAAAILSNGTFAVNVLGDHDAATADLFAGRTGIAGPERFDAVEWEPGTTGCPRLVDARATFECRLAETSRVGTHLILFGAVEAVVPGSAAGSALVYAERRYRRLAPLSA
ncbi:flavin reductase family protein [Methyloraptor flagellatus]|uniref:Flavin reductase family protein n=1 Tax=Methyloraptor flagellatus TaxID=3162530 RepID=A0AAU7XCV4_9HYPH